MYMYVVQWYKAYSVSMAHVLAKPIQPTVINYKHVVYIVIQKVKHLTKIQSGVQAFFDLNSTCVTTRRLLNIHVHVY